MTKSYFSNINSNKETKQTRVDTNMEGQDLDWAKKTIYKPLEDAGFHPFMVIGLPKDWQENERGSALPLAVFKVTDPGDLLMLLMEAVEGISRAFKDVPAILVTESLAKLVALRTKIQETGEESAIEELEEATGELIERMFNGLGDNLEKLEEEK